MSDDANTFLGYPVFTDPEVERLAKKPVGLTGKAGTREFITVSEVMRDLHAQGLIDGLSREETRALVERTLRERVAATPEFKRWARWYLPFGGASRWEHLRAVFRKPR